MRRIAGASRVGASDVARPRPVPPYFDNLIDAYRRGLTGRCVHLGYWHDRDDGNFARAQGELDRVVLELAGVQAGQSVLDVGCGFGGTIARLNDTLDGVRLAGVNIDDRQIDICRRIAARPGNRLSWCIADAGRLPFSTASFDRLLSVEAMFHFPSRRQFFAEAARVMKPGGVLAGTDILIAPAARDAALPIETILQDGFGPWPDVWGADADHARLAADTGLTGHVRDISAAVAPSYRYTAPPHADPADPRAPAPLRASAALRWLHDRGLLRYVCFRFERPAEMGPPR
jgi:SAM-dependent methyltransferase